MSNPNAAEQAIARRLLGWVVCAKRPLKWHEIQGAVSIDLKEESVEFDARRLRVNARELCGSLLQIQPGDRVDLVHRTARMWVSCRERRSICLINSSYLTQENHVQVTEVEKEMALLCMHYLVFECFGHDLSSEELSEYILDGSFAFQEYAALHWIDHLESMSSNDLLSLEDLSFIIDDYTTKYGQYDREQEVFLQPAMLDPESSSSSSLPAITRAMVKQTRTTRTNDEGLNALGTLGDIMGKVRIGMEQLAGTLSSDDLAKEMETYYGRNWFKCPKHPCFYFHEGFSSAKLRDRHVERHERPFCCTEAGCFRVQIGFSSEKELKKHTSITHPDPGALSWKFFKVKEPKPRRSFQCTLCVRKFTRSTSLRQHIRTHTGEMPYSCSVCGKAFARPMNCKRHEMLHSGGKSFVCRGELTTGGAWGCGRWFTRPETLGRHIRSKGGICFKPLHDEEAFERQRIFNEQVSKAQGVSEHQMQNRNTTSQGFRLPEALTLQYPALQRLDWQQIDQELNTGDSPDGQETTQVPLEFSMDWTRTSTTYNDDTVA